MLINVDYEVIITKTIISIKQSLLPPPGVSVTQQMILDKTD